MTMNLTKQTEMVFDRKHEENLTAENLFGKI
jgi:hypothetical protein